jgi:hypothetical protein
MQLDDRRSTINRPRPYVTSLETIVRMAAGTASGRSSQHPDNQQQHDRCNRRNDQRSNASNPVRKEKEHVRLCARLVCQRSRLQKLPAISLTPVN